MDGCLVGDISTLWSLFFRLPLVILPVPPVRKERCFGLILTSPPGMMVDAELRFDATRLPFLVFCFADLWVFHNTIKKNFLGVMPYVLSKKRRSRKLVTSIYYFGTNLSDTKGYDQSANSSAFVIISLEVIAILVVTIKSDFGDRPDLDAATMFDTLCLALSHAAIFLVYFFLSYLQATLLRTDIGRTPHALI